MLNVKPIENEPLEAHAYLRQDNGVPADTSSSSSFWDKLTPAGQQLFTFKGLSDFGIGFVNATEVYDVQNIQKCNEIIENTWMTEAKQAKEEALEGRFFDAARSFLAMLSSSDEIAKGCYAGFYEVASTYDDTVK